MDVSKRLLAGLKGKLIPCPSDLKWDKPLTSPSLQSDSFNIGMLTAQGTRIWVLSNDFGDPAPAPDRYIWGSFIDSTWQGYQSNFANTPCEKVDFMQRDLPGLLKTRRSFAIFKNANLVIWTINLYDAANTYINPRLRPWLDSWSSNPQTFPNLNIISVDWFETIGWFMDRIMELNRKERGPIVPAAQSAFNAPAADDSKLQPGNYTALVGGESSAVPFYDAARIGKMLSAVGLDWSTCLAEIEKAGERLPDKFLTELNAKGFSTHHVLDFVDWYRKKGGQI